MLLIPANKDIPETARMLLYVSNHWDSLMTEADKYYTKIYEEAENRESEKRLAYSRGFLASKAKK